jgi:hypothetical protein
LAAKLQGKTVRRALISLSRMEEAEKLREVVKKSPEKAKKVHLYNQHQPPPHLGSLIRHLFLLNTFAVD